MPRRVTPIHFALLPAACAALVLLAGCMGDDDEAKKDRNAQRVVAPAELVGEWHMTEGSRGLFKRDGHVEASDKPYSITFLDDGWVKFDSVVDDVKGGGTYTKCVGTWLLEHDVVVNNKPAPNVITLQLRRVQDRCFLKLLITEQEKQVRLWNTYGDPKKLEYIEYERPGAKDDKPRW